MDVFGLGRHDLDPGRHLESDLLSGLKGLRDGNIMRRGTGDMSDILRFENMDFSGNRSLFLRTT